MTNDALGPMPEPQVEPGEPNPGGVDAITGELRTPVGADLPPQLCLAVDEAPGLDGGERESPA